MSAWCSRASLDEVDGLDQHVGRRLVHKRPTPSRRRRRRAAATRPARPRERAVTHPAGDASGIRFVMASASGTVHRRARTAQGPAQWGRRVGQRARRRGAAGRSACGGRASGRRGRRGACAKLVGGIGDKVGAPLRRHADLVVAASSGSTVSSSSRQASLLAASSADERDVLRQVAHHRPHASIVGAQQAQARGTAGSTPAGAPAGDEGARVGGGARAGGGGGTARARVSPAHLHHGGSRARAARRGPRTVHGDPGGSVRRFSGRIFARIVCRATWSIESETIHREACNAPDVGRLRGKDVGGQAAPAASAASRAAGPAICHYSAPLGSRGHAFAARICAGVVRTESRADAVDHPASGLATASRRDARKKKWPGAPSRCVCLRRSCRRRRSTRPGRRDVGSCSANSVTSSGTNGRRTIGRTPRTDRDNCNLLASAPGRTAETIFQLCGRRSPAAHASADQDQTAAAHLVTCGDRRTSR